ncbi:MAG: DUF4402 domain-containing protein [Caulobacteraceae bacterium]
MKLKIAAVAALLLAGAAAPALAAQSSGTVNASATVIQPLTVSQTTAMDFGKLVMNAGSPGAGTVVLTAANGRSTTGGVDLVGTTAAAGVVQVVGQTGNNYTVTLPSSTTLTGPGTAMTLDTFNSSDTLTPIAGTNNIHIGATLHVNAAQTAGAYTGSFVVTAAYD